MKTNITATMYSEEKDQHITLILIQDDIGYYWVDGEGCNYRVYAKSKKDAIMAAAEVWKDCDFKIPNSTIIAECY